MDYEEYEKLCEQIKKDNEEHLEIFQSELEKSGLSEKTIRKHVNNADFYINEFLLYEEPVPMKEGCGCIDGFLGYFFIRKCMWSTPATIKSTATSLKKFYKCMADCGRVEKEDYNELCDSIKYGMDDWLSDCSQFNDPSQPSPFSFF